MKPLLDARVAFGDPEIVEMITKADQVRVLSELGWRRSQDMPADSELWVKDFDGESADIIVVSERPADRVLRLGEMINAVSRLERIPVLRLVLALIPELPIDAKEEP